MCRHEVLPDVFFRHYQPLKYDLKVEPTVSCWSLLFLLLTKYNKKFSYLFGIYQDFSTTNPKTPSLPKQTSFSDIFAVFPTYCPMCASTDLRSIRPQSYANLGHCVNVGRQLSSKDDFLFFLVFQMVSTAIST